MLSRKQSKQKHETVYRNILLLTVPSFLLILLILELTFAYIIPAAQVPYYYYDQNDRILRFDTTEQREGVYTIGYLAQQRARWRINNEGWNSGIDFKDTKEKLRIAIIGDSYVEALQVNVGDSLAGQLRRSLYPDVEVYDFGISGASLSDYLQMARYARAHFDPDVLVVNVVHNDFDESLCSVKQQVGRLCLEVEHDNVGEAPISPYRPNSLFRAARRVALIRYLVINLKVSMSLVHTWLSKMTNTQFNANIDVHQVGTRKDQINQATNYVLKTLLRENGGKPIIFLIDAPRGDIYAGTLAHSKILWLNELLRTNCKEFGFDFIDLTEEFNKQFNAHHLHFESEHDWHWNEFGHKVAAQKLYDHLVLRLKLGRANQKAFKPEIDQN